MVTISGNRPFKRYGAAALVVLGFLACVVAMGARERHLATVTLCNLWADPTKPIPTEAAIANAISRGADVNGLRGAMTPLMLACRRGDSSGAAFLLAHGANVNESLGGYTALMAAVDGSPHSGCVRLLVNRGANVNSSANGFETPLMLAAGQDDLALSRYLLDHWANVNAVDFNGETALMQAATGSDFEIVRLLVERGANVEQQRKCDGDTAVWEALRAGNMNIARFLFHNGATVDQKDSGGFPQFWSLVSASDWAEIRTLQSLGLNIDEKCDNLTQTALMNNAAYGSVDAMRHLIELGANIHARDNHGDSALWLAANEGRLDSVKLLFALGCSVNERANDGSTPLMRCIERIGMDTESEAQPRTVGEAVPNVRNEIACADFLIAHGADLNAKDDRGETALDYADDGNFISCERYLLAKGAHVH